MTRYIVLSRPNPHLPHDSVELQSPPPPDALTDEIAQRNAEKIIGQLVCETGANASTSANANANANAGIVAPIVSAEGKPASRPGIPQARAEAPTPAAHKPAAKAPRPVMRQPDPDEARLRAALTEGDDFGQKVSTHAGLAARLRPVLRPAHGLAIAAVLAVVLWPLVVGAAVLLALGAGVTATLLLRRAVDSGRWRHFSRRHPRTAERLRRTADRIAVRVDRVLDLLPAALADRLAWPDLSEPLAG